MLNDVRLALHNGVYAFTDTLKSLHKREDHKYAKERLSADIIRLVHSIEKGLAIETPRLGFGEKKITALLELVRKYQKLQTGDSTCVYMASDVIGAYIDYHEHSNYSSEMIENIKKEYMNSFQYVNGGKRDTRYGGITEIDIDELNYNIESVELLFQTRHSIREFDIGSVDEEIVKKAVQLAQRAPSACNRQAVKVYSIDRDKYLKDFKATLDGIGGFANSADRFLVVTGIKTAYEESENQQFIVSASIFAGYLSLALHLYKIGSCIVQRSIEENDNWKAFRRIHNIEDDEQIVCVIAIGKMKRKTKVPISHRYSIESIYRKL